MYEDIVDNSANTFHRGNRRACGVYVLRCHRALFRGAIWNFNKENKEKKE